MQARSERRDQSRRAARRRRVRRDDAGIGGARGWIRVHMRVLPHRRAGHAPRLRQVRQRAGQRVPGDRQTAGAHEARVGGGDSRAHGVLCAGGGAERVSAHADGATDRTDQKGDGGLQDVVCHVPDGSRRSQGCDRDHAVLQAHRYLADMGRHPR